MSSSEGSGSDHQYEAESSSEDDQASQTERVPPEVSHLSEHVGVDHKSDPLPDFGYEQRNPEFIELHNERRAPATDREVNRFHSPDENPFAPEESYYTRPNRYYGPASTWRSWTKEERAIGESLNREGARNLSAHLYNAHVLSAKARNGGSNQSTRGKGKQSAAWADESNGNEDNAFMPPTLWTAWPLPPNDVPQGSLVPETGLNNLRTPRDPRPSALLEDCLIATTARESRKRWGARRWQWLPGSEGNLRFIKTRESSEEETSELRDTFDAGGSAEEEEEDPDVPIFTSQPFNESDEISSDESLAGAVEDDDMYRVNPDARPVPLADDDKARQLLLPSTRHILSKLDDLLLGLHKSRQAYAVNRSSDAEDDIIPDETTDTEAVGKRGRTRGRRGSRKTTMASSIEGLHPDISESSRDSPKKKDHHGRLGTRDWSDVLGMASLTGWSPQVVERASERCAALFGENMLFRTFVEGSREEKSFFMEQLATGNEPEYGSKIGEGFTEESAADLLNSQAPNESLHSLPVPASSAEQRRLRSCPYRWCDRHSKPFKEKHHVIRHLKSVHRNEPPPLLSDFLSSPMPSSEPEIKRPRDDRIFCPVETCERQKGLPFVSTKRLYNHVRRMHPKVDVNQVKKLQKKTRGERRGGFRWDGDSVASQEKQKQLHQKAALPEGCNYCFLRNQKCDLESPQCGLCSEMQRQCEYSREMLNAEAAETTREEGGDESYDADKGYGSVRR